MRGALAVSSNVYFYSIGGGFKDQKGIGISNIEKYVRMFGFGAVTGMSISGEQEGVIPSPEWKAEVFEGDDWRLGDTYNTSIGQYGFQVTPIQAVRAVSALANGGRLITPTLKANEKAGGSSLALSEDDIAVVTEGMRQAVTDGTAKGLYYTDFAVAAKTGTAELGTRKEKVNSWIVGFFPYDKPKYAFAILMEGGRSDNLIGGVSIMRKLFDFMKVNTKEYVVISEDSL